MVEELVVRWRRGLSGMPSRFHVAQGRTFKRVVDGCVRSDLTNQMLLGRKQKEYLIKQNKHEKVFLQIYFSFVSEDTETHRKDFHISVETLLISNLPSTRSPDIPVD